MLQYDFLNLSPSEFEMLVRDLVQAHFKTTVESFGEGADTGIDLRFTLDGGLCIVQCKRIERFDNLMAKLKEEVDKIKALKPSRYFVATSFDLSPSQKDKIKNLFGDFIKDTADILGRSGLNNLLGQHPGVEQIYYKLWLTSANVLERILQAEVYNRSRFKMEEIQRRTKLYVQNPSFPEALQLLKDNHYVLISGLPGIGKSTLAYMLAYYLLSQGFEQFVYLSESIADAYKINSDKRTVYLFDDFLGTNFLKTRYRQNEDNQLLEFIYQVSQSKKDMLILSTREYILQQAKSFFMRFDDPAFDISKCTLNLGSYTSLIRAQILYNHLYFHHLPPEYLEPIVAEEIYMQLVFHANFSPRIIEAIIDKGRWKMMEPKAFPSYLKQSFDNPEFVWKSIYENEISPLAQYALAILATFDSEIYLNDFEKALHYFVEKSGRKSNPEFHLLKFRSIIKELEDTFVTIEADEDGVLGIDFQNPSIKDFLRRFLSQPENQTLLKEVLEHAVFIDQLTAAVGETREEREYSWLTTTTGTKIALRPGMMETVKQKIIHDFDQLETAHSARYTPEGKDVFKRYYQGRDVYTKLEYLMNEYLYTDDRSDYHHFIALKLQGLLAFDEMDYHMRHSFETLFKKLHPYLNYHPKEIASRYGKTIAFISDWPFLAWLEEQHPGSTEPFKNNTEEIQAAYRRSVTTEKRSISEVYNHTITTLEMIEKMFGINVNADIWILRGRMKRSGLYSAMYPLTGISELMSIKPVEGYKEKDKIRQLFKGLLNEEANG